MKTPLPINNRPGLATLHYRVGTYGDFRASMLARLSDRDPPFTPLNQLRTRNPDDPTIALIDAFALLGEILTFYQERLANEGFLRTATEPQSVQELARLRGYRLMPGVASSVVLAFTLDPGSSVTLPAGSRAQSVPGPGQTPQSFETTGDLAASGAWNAMVPRMTRPTQPSPDLEAVAVSGISTGLKPNDPLLLVVNGKPKLRHVSGLAVDAARQRTVINLRETSAAPAKLSTAARSSFAALAPPATQAGAPSAPPASPDTLVTQWAAKYATLARKSPAQHPPNAQALSRSIPLLFAPDAESALTLTAGVSPAQRKAVFRALAATPLEPTDSPPLEVHAFRATTAPFGNRAPPQVIIDSSGRLQPPQEWKLSGPTFGPEKLFAIEITLQTNGNTTLPVFVRVVNSLQGQAASSPGESLGLVSNITFDDVTVVLSLPPVPGRETSGSLPAGDVSVKLTRLRTTPTPGLIMELVYTFKGQPLSIRVQVHDTAPPTAINLRPTDAQVTLDANQDNAPAWRILGSLRPVVGTEPIEAPRTLHLDGTFETITPDTWIAFDAPDDSTLPAPPAPVKVASVNTIARTAYGQTARTTRLGLSGPWLDPEADFTRAIRQTTVYADSTPLTRVGEDITDPVPKTAGQPTLELDGLVTGLTAGRWLVVSGERVDMPGVIAQEVVMLAGVSHGGESVTSASRTTIAVDETPHTTLTFSSPLAYSYKRETAQVFGNVAPATQGESTDEILGSGNGASTNQTFTLKKPPLTYVPAVTPTGNASTLRVRVNNIEWHEVDTLAAAAPGARVFVTATAADGNVTVKFGDGVHGARLPTGTENIRAHYRSGLGRSGNLDPGTITTLLSRPLGVTGVTNPAPASGGGDMESPDAARANIPLGLVSLSRLISLSDYQDFAAAFAGIGKAAVRRFAGPDGPLIHLTLAGDDDAALDPDNPPLRTLDIAVRQFGDPAMDVELAPRAARLAVIQAAVAVDPDRQWTTIEPVVRAALLDTFSFARRGLGQTLHASEVVATIQAILGVSYVDLQVLTDVPQPTEIEDLQAAIQRGGVRDLVAQPARVDRSFSGRPRRLLPADFVYLSGLLPDMLMLSEIKS